MSVLATLRKDRAGDWTGLDDYVRELRHRETAALAALAGVLSAPADEQKELADHAEAAAVLLEVARDLRVPKGARLGAARCLLESGIAEPFVGHLFSGAGDLVTDPRLGAFGRKLVESGLPCALRLGGEPAQISLAAGAFARAVHAAASAVGTPRVEELLAAAPELHAGAVAGLFALGLAPLPEGHRTGWARLLTETCAAHRRAPAAAKRLGMAPQWPPNLPEAFAAMVRDAEQSSAGVRSEDAAAAPPEPKKPAPIPAPTEAAPSSAPRPARPLGPPIRKSAVRKPTGTVVEVPTVLPPKPMEALAGRRGAASAQRGRVEQEDLRFDARGRRIPRADRWADKHFQWETPILPSPSLRAPAKALPAQGPFAARLRAVFEDRPEAVDRLCAAAEALAAVRGEGELTRELKAELARSTWRDKIPPAEQLDRLRGILRDGTHPAPWRSAAGLLLAFFVSGAT
jgi:hypothetical protein